MTAMPRASQILLVGQRIRQLRKSRHLTQADLASRIGIAQSDLSRMENGEYKVGLDTLFRILQVFELSMSSFFEEASPEAEESTAHVENSSENQTYSESGGLAGSGTGAVLKDERDQLLSDWTELSDEGRREVREFISFKRMQAESRRPLLQPKWKPGVELIAHAPAGISELAAPSASPSEESNSAPSASKPNSQVQASIAIDRVHGNSRDHGDHDDNA